MGGGSPKSEGDLNYSMNNSLRMISCSGPHKLYVMMRKMLPPPLFDVMADHIHYTEKVGVPGVLSGCAMDCMRLVQSRLLIPPEFFMYAGFWGSSWEPVDPVVADPVRQDNDKRNNIQIYTEIPY